jgi:hypothetical protein
MMIRFSKRISLLRAVVLLVTISAIESNVLLVRENFILISAISYILLIQQMPTGTYGISAVYFCYCAARAYLLQD